MGIDVGLKSFATLSDGQEIENPRFGKQEDSAVVRAQRNLQKQPKGSKAREHRRKILSRVYERSKFRRDNFAHQHSRRIVNQFGIICVEDLNINRMNKLHTLAKSIMDAAWSNFFSYMSDKAEEAGRLFIAVNPAYTTQTCSQCGYRQKMLLAQRIFDCPGCSLHLDRDLNASLNILGLGLQSLAKA